MEKREFAFPCFLNIFKFFKYSIFIKMAYEKEINNVMSIEEVIVDKHNELNIYTILNDVLIFQKL